MDMSLVIDQVAQCGAHCDRDLRSEDEQVTCSQCKQPFHVECVSFGDAVKGGRTRSTRQVSWTDWVCVICKGKTRLHVGNVNSPAPKRIAAKSSPCTSPAPTPPPNPSISMKAHVSTSMSVDKHEPLLNKLMEHIDSKLAELTDKCMERVESCVKRCVKEVETKCADIVTSIQYVTDRLDDFESKYNDVPEKMSGMQAEIDELKRQLLVSRNRQDECDQLARMCNVEIQNVPERKGENLVDAVLNLCKAVDISISAKEIVSVHRVPTGPYRAGETTDNTHAEGRPKNIIARMPTRTLRDDIVAATRVAARNKRPVTTEHLKIVGPVRRVYAHEHLTLDRKLLFRDARIKCKDLHYEYVWVKHGTILALKNKNPETRVVAIKCPSDLYKIV